VQEVLTTLAIFTPYPNRIPSAKPTVAMKEACMVRLDHQLIQKALCSIDGANVHRLKELIFAYEQAVDTHTTTCRHMLSMQCNTRCGFVAM
jgi:hypothetical protein